MYFFGTVQEKILSIGVKSEYRIGLEFQHLRHSGLGLLIDIEYGDPGLVMLAEEHKIGPLEQKVHTDHDLLALQIIDLVAARLVLPDVDDAHFGRHVPVQRLAGVDHVVLRVQCLEAAECGDLVLFYRPLEHALRLRQQVVYDDVLPACVRDFRLVQRVGVGLQGLLVEAHCLGDCQSHSVQDLLVLIVEHRLFGVFGDYGQVHVLAGVSFHHFSIEIQYRRIIYQTVSHSKC